jgi:DNA polymerase III subunit delta'
MNSASPPATELFWLAPQRAALRQARAQGRFPHALLIQDMPGGGGEQLALAAAQTLLCARADAPCGECADCLRVTRLAHPDLWLVAPEEESRQIKVDQIRALNEMLALSGHGATGTVAIIDPADMLNANASNALLKTLEEPRPGVLIVLVTMAMARLPATVRSRCQRLAIRVPELAESAAWLRRQRGSGEWEEVLEILGNAPLRAFAVEPGAVLRVRAETDAQLAGALAGTLEIPAAAAAWARDAFELRLQCAENWITRRMQERLTPGGDMTEVHSSAHLPAANSSMNMRNLIRLADTLHELRRLAATSINKALAVEQLLWQLRAARPSQVNVGAG